MHRIVAFDVSKHRIGTRTVYGAGSAQLNGALIFFVAPDNAVDAEQAADMRCRSANG